MAALNSVVLQRDYWAAHHNQERRECFYSGGEATGQIRERFNVLYGAYDTAEWRSEELRRDRDPYYAYVHGSEDFSVAALVSSLRVELVCALVSSSLLLSSLTKNAGGTNIW